MDITDILDIARAYANLGWSVQAQIVHIAEDRLHRANPNALRIIATDLLTVIADRAQGDLRREVKTMIADINRYLSRPETDSLQRELRELGLDD